MVENLPISQFVNAPMMITDFGFRITDEGLQTIKNVPTPSPLGEGWGEGRGQVANLITGQCANDDYELRMKDYKQ